MASVTEDLEEMTLLLKKSILISGMLIATDYTVMRSVVDRLKNKEEFTSQRLLYASNSYKIVATSESITDLDIVVINENGTVIESDVQSTRCYSTPTNVLGQNRKSECVSSTNSRVR
jgi:hypothetical protein